MAAYKDGFSGPALDLEVGHRLGLRWFTLTQVQHGSVTITNRIEAPIHFKCGCGSEHDVVDSVPANAWIEEHKQPVSYPVLAGARDKWHPGENTARCLRHGNLYYMDEPPLPPKGHVVPHDGCHCGFWAYWRLGAKAVTEPAVPGLVKGYGNIIEGELGFRVSHAKILALALVGHSPNLANTLEMRYNIEVFNSVAGLLEMWKDRAPEGQPPLGDDYFPAVAGEADGGTWCARCKPKRASKGRWSTVVSFCANCNPGGTVVYTPPTSSGGAGGNTSVSYHPGGIVATGGGGGGGVSVNPGGGGGMSNSGSGGAGGGASFPGFGGVAGGWVAPVSTTSVSTAGAGLRAVDEALKRFQRSRKW